MKTTPKQTYSIGRKDFFTILLVYAKAFSTGGSIPLILTHFSAPTTGAKIWTLGIKEKDIKIILRHYALHTLGITVQKIQTAPIEWIVTGTKVPTETEELLQQNFHNEWLPTMKKDLSVRVYNALRKYSSEEPIKSLTLEGFLNHKKWAPNLIPGFGKKSYVEFIACMQEKGLGKQHFLFLEW